MSLDIHATSSKSKAGRKMPDLQMDIPIHEAIFFAPKMKMALLSRMKVYYDDCEFEPRELHALQGELIARIAAHLEGKVVDFLNSFNTLVKNAIGSDVGIFVFAD